MDNFSLMPVEHQPDFGDATLVPVEHDPFGDNGETPQVQAQPSAQTAPAQTQLQVPPQQAQSSTAHENLQDIGSPLIGDGGQLFPGTAFGQKAADVAGKVAYGMMRQVATLPQRAIDAARVSFEHNYGPGPSKLSDSDIWTDPLSAVTAETALTMMGGSGPVPAPAGILGANKLLRGVGKNELGSLSANAPTGKFYSVLHETRLKPTSYPGPRRAHDREANESFLRTMEDDEAFARDMQNSGVSLRRTPTGLVPRIPPAGFSWHHADEPGVMQLVPREQHDPGSIFQDILHPDRKGGYSKWGKS